MSKMARPRAWLFVPGDRPFQTAARAIDGK